MAKLNKSYTCGSLFLTSRESLNASQIVFVSRGNLLHTNWIHYKRVSNWWDTLSIESSHGWCHEILLWAKRAQISNKTSDDHLLFFVKPVTFHSNENTAPSHTTSIVFQHSANDWLTFWLLSLRTSLIMTTHKNTQFCRARAEFDLAENYHSWS